jgi:surfeit locus 1 family protein
VTMTSGPDQARARGLGRRLIVPVILFVIGLGVLLSLGIWQLERKAWKEALIARVEASAKAEPRSLAMLRGTQEEIAFSRVTLHGRFVPNAEFHVWSPQKAGPGWLIVGVLALEKADGPATPYDHVLVLRGIVPDALKSAAARSETERVGEGLMAVTGRLRYAKAGAFTPSPDPAKNIWHALDGEAMRRAAVRHLMRAAPTATFDEAALLRASAPFFVEAEGKTGSGEWPRPQPAPLSLANDHLNYALTWFALALVLVVMFGFWLWREIAAVKLETAGNAA